MQLKVDRIYERRDGKTTTIVKKRSDPYYGLYPFVDEFGYVYSASGNYWVDPGRKSPLDLIKEVEYAPVETVFKEHQPFKYSKEIIEWARGTPIQMKRPENNHWEDMDPPGKGLYSWSDKNEYRIKPEPLRPITRMLILTKDGVSGGFPDIDAVNIVCKEKEILQILEVTIDPETRNVKHTWKNP